MPVYMYVEEKWFSLDCAPSLQLSVLRGRKHGTTDEPSINNSDVNKTKFLRPRPK